MVERYGALSRGSATWLLYGAFSCMAFLLNGLVSMEGPAARAIS